MARESRRASRRNRDKDTKGKTDTRVKTGVCRSSYMFCNRLETDEHGNKKCRTAILIPKKDTKTVKAIEAAIKAAATEKFGNDINVKSRKFKYPLRDGDAELADGDITGDHMKDHYFINATGYKLPGVVDEDLNPIDDPEELEDILVSGYYFRFSITMKAFDNESRGVRAVLNNIMFVKEGDRLDGGVSAEDDFADFAD